MTVNVFRLDAVRKQLVQQRAALAFGDADDARGEMLADEQGLAPGLRMGAHHRVHDRLDLVDLGLGQLRAPRIAGAQLFVAGPDEARATSRIAREKYGSFIKPSQPGEPLTKGEQAVFELLPG